MCDQAERRHRSAQDPARRRAHPLTLRSLVSTGIDFNRALRSLRGCRGFLLGGEASSRRISDRRFCTSAEKMYARGVIIEIDSGAIGPVPCARAHATHSA